MENICVYQHIRLDTKEVFYIGIGIPSRPFNKVNRSKLWKRVVAKAGYEIEVIINNVSWSEAIDIEKYLIKFYGRRDLGLGNLINMTDGGDGRVNQIVSEETRDKLSKAKIGKLATEETKVNMSISHLGKKNSEESKIKVSNSLKGHTGWNTGFKHSEESKLKMQDKPNYCKRIIDEATGIIYKSIAEVSRIFKIKYTTLKAWLEGRVVNKSTFKFI